MLHTPPHNHLGPKRRPKKKPYFISKPYDRNINILVTIIIIKL